MVDDENVVRSFTSTVLRRAGYCVLEAEDGRVAVEVLSAESEEPSLVITDIRMPRMNGVELVEHIRAHHPRLPVICVSGFADPLSPNGHYFLPKPFKPNALVALVTDVLGIQPSRGESPAARESQAVFDPISADTHPEG